ncbi:MAG TPA: hypothetical protein VF698_02555 [Thermoanaerobaculia bacterium]
MPAADVESQLDSGVYLCLIDLRKEVEAPPLVREERAAAGDLLQVIVTEFQEAGLADRAAVALRYLNDVLETTESEAAAAHVREYISRARYEPSLVFVPPAAN